MKVEANRDEAISPCFRTRKSSSPERTWCQWYCILLCETRTTKTFFIYLHIYDFLESPWPRISTGAFFVILRYTLKIGWWTNKVWKPMIKDLLLSCIKHNFMFYEIKIPVSYPWLYLRYTWTHRTRTWTIRISLNRWFAERLYQESMWGIGEIIFPKKKNKF